MSKKYNAADRQRMMRPDMPHAETSLEYRTWLYEQSRAGIFHLVDLKRAGHSPTQTEHRIPSDDSALRRIKPDLMVSAVGSPSDWVTTA